MNYLAHQVLSGEDDEIRFGGFIADAVKGKAHENFTKKIQYGILLHREIDWFTDQHQLITQLKEEIRTHFGRYAGVAVDLYMDHFLAKNWNDFHNIKLEDYTSDTYDIVRKYHELLPFKLQRMFKYMSKDDWLFNYQFESGIEMAFNGLAQRIKFDSGLENGLNALKSNYKVLMSGFNEFYPLIENHAKRHRNDFIASL